MKNTTKLLTVVAFLTLVSIPSKTLQSIKEQVTAKAKTNTLRIYNWEDYIYEPESDDDEPSILDQFVQDYFDRTGIRVNIEYRTFSTNEDMYNNIKLSGAQYDLIVPSDYMIQRMKNEDMLEKYDYEDGYTSIANYNDYASNYLFNLFEENDWHEYAVGYMWGTMGLVYNSKYVDRADMNSWSILWDNKYHKMMTVKDSMREGYLIGLLNVYENELLDLKKQLEENAISAKEYNTQINDLLNDVTPETIKKVGQSLKELKRNIYGTEVDQGKNDIVKGLIQINTAWSGDAVYSIYEAADAGNDVLRYKVPEEGSNIWYDAFVMPKGANKELAQDFINFVSNPSIAVINMDYIGYTTFIAGDEVLDYVLDYDEVIEQREDSLALDLSYFFNETLSEERSIDEARIHIASEQIGGQLTTQFPSLDEITRSAVMRDFGTSNNLVIEMWAQFKATEGQLWMYIVGGAILLSLIGLAAYGIISNHQNTRRRRRKHGTK